MTVKNRAGAKTPEGYRMINRGAGRGEVFLYGPIGMDFWGDGISAKVFADDLKKLGNVSMIDVRINSEGGDVFDGKAMYTLLNDHPAKVIVHIDGLAASAASFIAMAGDEIEIAEGAFVMIHDCTGGCMGRAEDMRSYANLLDAANGSVVDVYVARTGNDAATIKKWMKDETWLSGKDAVSHKFADRMVGNLKVAASSVKRPGMFKNLPVSLRPNRNAAAQAMAGITK
jgi:ATP-dependent Clp protease protease subunit